MAMLNFNANDVEPTPDWSPIPEGEYDAIIIDSEMKPTRAGTGQYLELTFQVVSGEFHGRRVWSRLNLENPNVTAVEIARAELSSICRAVGVLQPQDSSELHDRPLRITVRCRKREDNGEISNEIKKYTAKKTGVIPPPESYRPASDSTESEAPPVPSSDDRPPWARGS